MRSLTIVPMRHRFCLCFGFLVAVQISAPIPKAVAQRAAPTGGKATVKPVPPQPEEPGLDRLSRNCETKLSLSLIHISEPTRPY